MKSCIIQKQRKMANWYAVYTRPRYERKVVEGLSKRKWPSYCPLHKARRLSWTGLKTTAPVLFPSYVFVRLEREHLMEVKKVEGVINPVYWRGEPVVVRDIEIEMLQRFLAVHKHVVLERAAVDSTAMVTLIQSPAVQKQEGIVALGAASAKLLLPSLGYVLVAVQQNQPRSMPNYVPFQQPEQLFQ
jgi:transcription antitermination factor NusG